MATLLKTVYGSWAGPNSKFRVVAQLYQNEDTGKGYDLFLRRYVEVKDGSNFNGTVLTISWGDSVSVSSGGKYASKDTQIGTKAYGTTYSLGASSIKAYYTGSSGTTYTSSTSISYTIPEPTYTVSYKANGGSGAPSSQTKTYNKNLTLSKTIPTRDGYKFVEWNTKSDGSGTSYAPGATYTINAALTLYAIWKRNGTMCMTEDGQTKKGKPYLYEGTTAKSGIPWMNVNGVWKKGGA